MGERFGEGDELFEGEFFRAYVAGDVSGSEGLLELFDGEVSLQQLEHHFASLREAPLHDLYEQPVQVWREQWLRAAD